MQSYLIYATEEEAKDRSRQAWVDVLGRPKKAEDVTEFLNGWTVGLDGETALITDGMALTAEESLAVTTSLDSQIFVTGTTDALATV